MSVPAESIFFDLWSATYDRPGLQRTTYRPIHDAVLNRLDGLKPDHVLDLGCGTGQLTERLGAAFPDALVVGADLSDGMLERATDSRSTGTQTRPPQQQSSPASSAREDVSSSPRSRRSPGLPMMRSSERRRWPGVRCGPSRNDSCDDCLKLPDSTFCIRAESRGWASCRGRC